MLFLLTQRTMKLLNIKKAFFLLYALTKVGRAFNFFVEDTVVNGSVKRLLSVTSILQQLL